LAEIDRPGVDRTGAIAFLARIEYGHLACHGTPTSDNQ
jgi:hypothetical protein